MRWGGVPCPLTLLSPLRHPASALSIYRTFVPRTVTRTEAPFAVTNTGSAEFMLQIRVLDVRGQTHHVVHLLSFKDSTEVCAPHQLGHDLSFSLSPSPQFSLSLSRPYFVSAFFFPPLSRPRPLTESCLSLQVPNEHRESITVSFDQAIPA